MPMASSRVGQQGAPRVDCFRRVGYGPAPDLSATAACAAACADAAAAGARACPLTGVAEGKRQLALAENVRFEGRRNILYQPR